MAIIAGFLNKLRDIFPALTSRIVLLHDWLIDRRVCGCSLRGKRAISVEGGTSYSPTCYWTLDQIFSPIEFKPSDHIVDVGCGKGRALAYFLHKKFPGRITGIEYEPDLASAARSWLKRNSSEKVRIIEGDAFAQTYDEYTDIYIFRPFETPYFIKFINLLEEQLTHPIRLYYMSDSINGGYLLNRPGWVLKKRCQSYRKYSLYLWRAPQTFSIWTFSPKNS